MYIYMRHMHHMLHVWWKPSLELTVRKWKKSHLSWCFTIQNAGNFPASYVTLQEGRYTYIWLVNYAFSMEHRGAGFFCIKFGSIRGPIRVSQVAGEMDFFAGWLVVGHYPTGRYFQGNPWHKMAETLRLRILFSSICSDISKNEPGLCE